MKIKKCSTRSSGGLVQTIHLLMFNVV